jgi:hypothetical protein
MLTILIRLNLNSTKNETGDFLPNFTEIGLAVRIAGYMNIAENQNQ